MRILEGCPVDSPWKESSAGSLWNYGTAGALVSCGEGCLQLKRVQLENRKAVKGKDFLMICLKYWLLNVTRCKKISLIFRRILFTFIPKSSAELYLNSSYNKKLSTEPWLKI